MSRDGVPLCPHHADATTPPLGWTMNDLRSANRASAADRSGPKTGEVVSGQSQPSSTPPQSGRQPSAPDRRVAPPREFDDDGIDGRGVESHDLDDFDGRDDDFDDFDDDEADGPLSFRVSRDLRSMTTSAGARSSRNGTDHTGHTGRAGRPGRTSNGPHPAPANGNSVNGRVADQLNGAARSGTGSRSRTGEATSGPPARRGRPAAGPVSRPAKRWDESAIEDEELDDEDRFPWHHQFENDEPTELQAKSRLLSRAFRSSVG